ncbi:MAG: hypothetical protein EKK60_15500 [Gordonia sp. (in: high G+C Gram-positive bacteria)]|nr:MAG: hypothetical protein EKK60_15500 [Gordonia sp. (in: high G+C Gram-positive bacteria)]
MAATVTNVGTNSSTSSSSTITLGSVTASVGDWLVVFVAANNAGAGGATAATQSASDGAGNTYTLRGSVLVRDPGNANDGCEFARFTCEVTSALSGGTITVNFSPNVTSKAILAYRVQPGAGETIAYSLASTGATGRSTTQGSGAAGTDANEYAFAGNAIETNTTVTGDSDTLDGSWSTMVTAVANTGSDLTSMTVTGQWKGPGTSLNFQNRATTTAAAKDFAGGALVLSSIAAASDVDVDVIPGALEVDGAIPTVAVSDNKSVSVVPGAAEVEGAVATVSVSDHKTVSVVAGAAELDGAIPTVALSDNKSVAVVPGAAEVAGATATVSVTDHKTVDVVAGAIEADGAVPTVATTAHQFVDVVSGALELDGAQATVVATADIFVDVVAGAAEVAGALPVVTVSDHQTVSVVPGSAELDGATPSVIVGQYVNVVPGAVELEGAIPTVAVSDHKTVDVVSGSIEIDGATPTVVVNVIVGVVSGVIELDGATAAVVATDNITIEVEPGTIHLIGSTPTVIGSVVVPPSAGAKGGGGARRQERGSAKVRRREVDEMVEGAYQRILAKRAEAEADPVPPSPKAVLRAIKAEPDGSAVTLAQVKAAMLRLDSILERLQAEIANDDEEAAFMLLAA